MQDRRLQDIEFSDKPPEKRTKYYPIISPQAGQTFRCLILSPTITFVNTHYDGHRTSPCFGIDKGCEHCHHPIFNGIRRKGYLAVLWGVKGRIGLAELTHEAGAVLGHQWRNLNIRGMILSLSRPGKSKRGRVVAVIDGKKNEGVFPEEPNIREVLWQIWLGQNNYSLAEERDYPPGYGLEHLQD